VPTHAAQDRTAEANAWLADQCRRAGCGTSPSEIDNYAALHPAWGRVAGFACGRVTVDGHTITIADLRVSVGDERHALKLADLLVARRPGSRLTYSMRSWAPRFLIARTIALNLPGRATITDIVKKSIDLADVLS